MTGREESEGYRKREREGIRIVFFLVFAFDIFSKRKTSYHRPKTFFVHFYPKKRPRKINF